MLSFDEIEDCCPDGEPLCGPDGQITVSAQWLHDFARAIAAKEREECALIADASEADEPYGHAKFRCTLIAQSIRSRSEG